MAGRRAASIGAEAVSIVRDALNNGAPAPLVTLAALPDGVPSEHEAVVDGDAESLILLREGDRVRAWFNICPHAGRRLDWAPGKFLVSKSGDLVCAVHGATFARVDGRCIAGPCVGESLREVPVEVRDGGVWLA
jgi:nitrite reductase/ring-hydroxylating ferredoxin subunit